MVADGGAKGVEGGVCTCGYKTYDVTDITNHIFNAHDITEDVSYGVYTEKIPA